MKSSNGGITAFVLVLVLAAVACGAFGSGFGSGVDSVRLFSDTAEIDGDGNVVVQGDNNVISRTSEDGRTRQDVENTAGIGFLILAVVVLYVVCRIGVFGGSGYYD